MALNLATSVGAAIGIGLFGGKWLDARFDTGNMLTIFGFILGAATAGKMLWDKLQEKEKKGPQPYRKNSENNND